MSDRRPTCDMGKSEHQELSPAPGSGGGLVRSALSNAAVLQRRSRSDPITLLMEESSFADGAGHRVSWRASERRDPAAPASCCGRCPSGPPDMHRRDEDAHGLAAPQDEWPNATSPRSDAVCQTGTPDRSIRSTSPTPVTITNGTRLPPLHIQRPNTSPLHTVTSLPRIFGNILARTSFRNLLIPT